MTEDPRIDVVLYCRISKDKTGEMLGVKRQLEDCRQIAHLRGWTIVAEYIDNDLSAASGKKHRPGFESVLDALTSGKAQGVVSWTLDRLTRNRADTVKLLETGEKARAIIGLVRGSDIDLGTPSGRLVAEILASVARAEIDVKADRQRRAVLQAAHAGRTSGGARRFGYDRGGMTVRPVEAAAIETAYESLLTLDGAVAVAAIARAWNDAELLPPQGKMAYRHWCDPDCEQEDPAECPDRLRLPSRWTGPVVSRTLRNPAYCGKRTHLGEVVADALWPPIVSEQTWRAAQVVLNDPGRRSTPGPRPRALLTGLAICGVCGSYVHASGNSRPGVRGYRCSGSLGHISRTAEPIEEFIAGLVIERLSRDDAKQLLVDPADVMDLDDVEKERVELEKGLDEIADMAADRTLTKAQVRRANERIQSRIAKIDALYESSARVDILGDLIGAEDVAGRWQTLDTDRQRAAINQLMEVALYPAGQGVRTFRPESVGTLWRDPRKA